MVVTTGTISGSSLSRSVFDCLCVHFFQWLNEGFAQFIQFKAMDYLNPEWNVYEGFVGTDLERAFNLDGLKNSHPIEVSCLYYLFLCLKTRQWC